jgi:hypothetical protein
MSLLDQMLGYNKQTKYEKDFLAKLERIAYALETLANCTASDKIRIEDVTS